MKRHNYFQEGFLILIGILIFSAAGVYGEEESITLTTYYPSPYGVYNEMRMYPHSPATIDCVPANENQAKGTLYYDATQDQLKVCGGDPLDWQDISGYWRLSGTSLFPRENNWNVGIGTDQPSTKLTIDFGNEVIPGVNANGIALIGNNNPGIIAARGDQELFTIGGVTSAAAYTTDSQLGDGVFASPGRILFGTGVVGSPPNVPTRMTITSDGNVGIGTTDPLQIKLYLDANIPTPAGRNGMQISTPLGHYVSLGGGIGTDGSNSAGLHIGNQAGLNQGGEGGTLYYDYDAPDRNLVAGSAGGIRIAALGKYPPAGRDIVFATNPSNVERMRITDNGNVGIGTANPNNSKGAPGYLDAADVYLRDVGKWASEASTPVISDDKVYKRLKQDPSGMVSYLMSSTDDICFLTGVLFDDPGSGDVNGAGCTIRKVGSEWYMDTYEEGNDVTCTARCINF